MVKTDRGYLIPVRDDDPKNKRQPAAQLPSLFDFTKGRDNVLLQGARPRQMKAVGRRRVCPGNQTRFDTRCR